MASRFTSEAANSMASSPESRSSGPLPPTRTSRTKIRRAVSASYSFTVKRPSRADCFQCTLRHSSPATMGRTE